MKRLARLNIRVSSVNTVADVFNPSPSRVVAEVPEEHQPQQHQQQEDTETIGSKRKMLSKTIHDEELKKLTTLCCINLLNQETLIDYFEHLTTM